MRDIWRAIGTISENSALVLVRLLGSWTFLLVDLVLTLLFPAVVTDWTISIETRAYDLIILMASMVIARTAARSSDTILDLLHTVERTLGAIMSLIDQFREEHTRRHAESKKQDERLQEIDSKVDRLEGKLDKVIAMMEATPDGR